MNTPPPSDISAPMYPGLSPHLPPFPVYTPLAGLPTFSMNPFPVPGYPLYVPSAEGGMPTLPPMMPMTPDVITQMERGTLTPTMPEWEKHLAELPPELQSILFAAFSAVIQTIGPDAAETMLPEFMWQVWSSRHANYTNLMHMRMQTGANTKETVEQELSRNVDEVVTAMHEGLKQYYETRHTLPTAEPTA